jgi:hypothetical protein
MQLVDLQRDVAVAVTRRTIPESARLLTGGDDPAARFTIHSRHYAASLSRSLIERFSATVWLAGAEFVTEAALGFVREHPPTHPCISEYGDAFPAYLASCAGTRLPYLEQFAMVDWHLGRLAVAVDVAPVQTLADCDPTRLADACLTLQPGTQYLALDWSLDELLRFYLAGDAPIQYALRQEPVWLELRGCRGELWLNRLTKGDYAFREVIADGTALGRAAEIAIGIDETFEPSRAVPDLVRAGLVTSVTYAEGAES